MSSDITRTPKSPADMSARLKTRTRYAAIAAAATTAVAYGLDAAFGTGGASMAYAAGWGALVGAAGMANYGVDVHDYLRPVGAQARSLGPWLLAGTTAAVALGIPWTAYHAGVDLAAGEHVVSVAADAVLSAGVVWPAIGAVYGAVRAAAANVKHAWYHPPSAQQPRS